MCFARHKGLWLNAVNDRKVALLRAYNQLTHSLTTRSSVLFEKQRIPELVKKFPTRMGERTGVYKVLVGKTEGKRPLGRPRRRREDNIKMDVQEVGCGDMDWIEFA